MHSSVKGLLLLGLLFGQLIAITAQDITCPPAYIDGCDPWSFDNQAGWASLCSRYANCGAGMQSPIDIPTSSLTCGSTCNRPEIVYGDQVRVDLFNIGETLVSVPDGGNYVNYHDVQYDLQWIEYRQPSEHSLGGDFSDFEAQFWHQSADGAWLAIAVLYDIDDDEENVFFASFWDHLPEYSNCYCGNGRIDFGEECDDGADNSNTLPDSCRLDCTLPICGDGVKDRTEECDKGASNNDTLPSTVTTGTNRACRSNCVYSFCGDNILDAGEECDDGNIFSGDGCSAFCESECGNGRVDGGEQCDEGDAGNADREVDGCRPGCVFAFCGDGVVDSGESCDNGAANSDITRNACRSNCVNAFCGDGVVDNGESCDPLGNAFCTADCTVITPTCGNGNIDAGEQCDAGNSNSDTAGARCRTDCTLPFCGDGVRDSGTLSLGVPESIVYNEQCDVIGGTTTCNPATCTNTCGDGFQDNNEQCDLGGGINTEPNHGNKPNQCRKGCIAPFCGDGIVDNGEQCDEGASNGSPSVSCDLFCNFKFCGDGFVDSLVTDRTPESCDDGNLNDDDGCSSVCQLECGDGHMTGLEQCDMGDMNANAPDSCKLDCMLPFCGDGYVDFNEECDYNAFGSSLLTCRENCKLPYCGDGITDAVFGEECDDGWMTNSDIMVGGCSTRCTRNDCGYYASSSVGDLDRAMACDGCFYSYMGSSTRPPCTGDVYWLVAQKVQKISEFQIEQFQYIWGDDVRRAQVGTCELDDRYSHRMCMCDSQMGSINMDARMACSEVPRKPALQTAFDMLNSNDSDAEGMMTAIHLLVDLIVREPLILPTYYTTGTNAAAMIACETEAFWRRGYADLWEAVELLRTLAMTNAMVESEALKSLVFFEHTLQFYQSLQKMTMNKVPTGTLTNALALMIGSGAASPYLPYDNYMQKNMKMVQQATLAENAPVLISKSVTGLQARLFRSAVGFNIDPEIHRYSHIPDEAIWHVRFVGVEFLKQYGYRNMDGSVMFNLSDEKVILESNIHNLWNYNHHYYE